MDLSLAKVHQTNTHDFVVFISIKFQYVKMNIKLNEKNKNC